MSLERISESPARSLETIVVSTKAMGSLGAAISFSIASYAIFEECREFPSAYRIAVIAKGAAVGVVFASTIGMLIGLNLVLCSHAGRAWRRLQALTAN